jgi:two-component sensor histidine kinase
MLVRSDRRVQPEPIRHQSGDFSFALKVREVPDVRQENMLAISLHELATNAAKYGSLSAADGHVEIAWSRTADGRLSLRWVESGGPPVKPPTHRGFGTSIMENIIGGQLKGEVRFDWHDRGLTCEIALPLAVLPPRH